MIASIGYARIAELSICWYQEYSEWLPRGSRHEDEKGEISFSSALDDDGYEL